MKLLEVLRKRNRTLLEMHAGMFFFGLLCQAVGAFFAKDQVNYALGLWCGVLLAMLGALHMYRTLDRSLDLGEAAVRKIFAGYVLRYVFLIAFMLIIMKAQIMNPLVVFLGYMSMKVAALIQPFTHKLINKIFHETDPDPEPSVPDDDSEQERDEEAPLE